MQKTLIVILIHFLRNAQNFVEKTSHEKDSEVFYKEFAKILEEKKLMK